MKTLRFTSCLLLSLCALRPFVRAQGSMVPPKTVLSVVNGFTRPVANATITVCPPNASGIPCSPVLTNAVFKDAALSQPLSNPFTTDANGNYQFAAASGTYTVTESASGFKGYSYQITVGSGVSAAQTISIIATLNGLNSPPKIGLNWGINGAGSILTQPLPALGNSGLVVPDFATDWDTSTEWPNVEYNSTGCTSVTISNSTPTIATFVGCNPSTLTTSDGVTPSSSTILTVAGRWNSIVDSQSLPIDLAISSCGSSTCTLQANTATPSLASSGFTWTAGQFRLYELGLGSRRDQMMKLLRAAGMDVLFVMKSTPNWYSGNTTDTNCHKASSLGNGSCYPPTDLSVSATCTTPSLVGQTTTGCSYKGFIRDFTRIEKERGTPIRYMAEWNEINHAPLDVVNQATSSVIGNGTTTTVTFAGTCQFVANQSIVVAGVTPSGFNGTYRVAAGCGGGSTLTYLNATNATASVQGTVSCCDANATAVNDGEWAGSIADAEKVVSDTTNSAYSIDPSLVTIAPSVDKLATSNGWGTNAGCGRGNSGADFLNSYFGIAGSQQSAKWGGYHAYLGYSPESQDYAFNTSFGDGSCANLTSLLGSDEQWANTEQSTSYSSPSSNTQVQISSATHSGGVCTLTTTQNISGWTGYNQANWIVGESIVVFGDSGTAPNCNTGAAGAVITGIPANNQVTYAIAGSSTPTVTAAFAYDYQIKAGMYSRSLAIQYFPLTSKGKALHPLIQAGYWVNQGAQAQGAPLCDIATGNVCTQPSIAAVAVGEFLNWIRSNGGVFSKGPCYADTTQWGYGYPGSALVRCDGSRPDGTDVEIVWSTDVGRWQVSYAVPTPGTFTIPPGHASFGHYCGITDAFPNCHPITGGAVTLPAGGYPLFLFP